MKPVISFVLCLCVSLCSFAGAHAGEEAPDGVWMDVGMEPYDDNPVPQVEGGNLRDQGFHAAAGVLGNYGELAFGVAVSGGLALFGDEGWLVGGRVAWQPTVG